jgi:hypothetical protein
MADSPRFKYSLQYLERMAKGHPPGEASPEDKKEPAAPKVTPEEELAPRSDFEKQMEALEAMLEKEQGQREDVDQVPQQGLKKDAQVVEGEVSLLDVAKNCLTAIGGGIVIGLFFNWFVGSVLITEVPVDLYGDA